MKQDTLKNMPRVTHIKSSDGIFYESDIYEMRTPQQIELQHKGEDECLIQFNKKIRKIETSTNITNNTTILNFTLTDDTIIRFRTPYPDYYNIILI